MKKEISISLLALGLAACGGDSGSSESSLGINTDFASSIRGTEIEPALTTATVSEGDNVTLNTNLTGSVLEDSSVRFNFTATETQKVALVLSSGAEDLDLSVSSQDLHLDSSGLSSNEVLVFDATAGQSYTLEVNSYEGQGSFQLKLVEANRSSLGLSKNEYFIEAQYTFTNVCVNDEETNTYDEAYNTNFIVNWKDGYIMTSIAEDKISFISVNNNSFTVSKSESDTEDGESYEYSRTENYTTNFETGELTGTLISNDTSTNNSRTEICKAEGVITAKVIL